MHSISFSFLALTSWLILQTVSNEEKSSKGSSSPDPTGTQNSDWKCYHCNNGLKDDEDCANFKKVDSTPDCKTPEFFFTMLSVVSGEFLRRNPRRGRPRLIRAASAAKTILMCTTVFMYGAELVGPQVMRDCINGTQKEIESGFKMLLPPANFMGFKTELDSLDPNKKKANVMSKASDGMKVEVEICTETLCNTMTIGNSAENPKTNNDGS